jgi:beta-glucosidase
MSKSHQSIRNLLFVAVLLLLSFNAAAAQSYRDSGLAVELRMKDLLFRMTLEEKFWQLFMLTSNLDGGVEKYKDGAFGLQIGAFRDSSNPADGFNTVQRHFIENTRLGIPIIQFEEALHGLVQKGATSFPQAIGLAATFDTSLMREVSRAIARECQARGIRQVLSPVVNIASDVRWGRVEETYGEDPFLTSEMGVAFVSEFEKYGIITTPKHLIANVGDGGRDSYPIHFNERLLREIYLPPFDACFRGGGSRSVMTSYNSLDGSPCTANDWLNKKLLRDELGFGGFIISDAGGVGGANVLHFTAKDYADATEKAMKGGLDVIFQTSFDHFGLFFPAFHNGSIPQDVIDTAVARVLRAKIEIGLFERPYIEASDSLSAHELADHRQLARKAAQESIVLLKNDKNALPLSRHLKKIAVLGPDADEARLGGYSGPGNDKVSILAGIRKKVGSSTQVVYAKGCPRVLTDYLTVPSENLFCLQGDTLRNGLLGTYFDNVQLSGSPVFTRVDSPIQFQWTLFSPDPVKLPNDFYSVRWTGKLKAPATGDFKIGIDGNDGYRLFLDNRLVIDNWQKITCRTHVTDYHFEKGKECDLRIEYFEPTGNAWFRLIWNVGVPTNSDSIMNEAVTLASESDVAVVVVGIEEGEFRDRALLNLPGRQEELINRVASTGKPVVVVLVGGSAITMTHCLDNVPAVLDVWYPGEAGGDAVADVLFGDYNPAGRLPITFPVAEGQLPLVYNHKPTGRGDDYLNLTGQPLFPFGYGLSYTQFDYGNLRFDRQQITAGDTAIAYFNVKNVGAKEGDEVVQLYIRDELASVARPVTELKGFQRIRLRPGESRALRFVISPNLLSMLDKELMPVVEPGDFRIMLGASSKDIRLRGILNVSK